MCNDGSDEHAASKERATALQRFPITYQLDITLKHFQHRHNRA